MGGKIKRRRVMMVSAVVAATAINFFSNSAHADTTATWTGTNGDWTDPTQWSTNPNYPNNGTPTGTDYQALINGDGGRPYSVSLNNDITLNALTLDNANATLNQAGGTLTSGTINVDAGTYLLDGGTISGGTVNVSGGTFLNYSLATLDGTPVGGITLAGTFLAGYSPNAYYPRSSGTGATTYLQGLINDPTGIMFYQTPQFLSYPDAPIYSYYNIALAGDTEFSGNGTTTFASAAGNNVNIVGKTGNERLTNDMGHTILAQGFVSNTYNYGENPFALTNQGLILADGTGYTFSVALNSEQSSNSGTIEGADSGTVSISSSTGPFSNSGTIQANGAGSNLGLALADGNNSGSIEISNGATGQMDISAGTSFTNTGTIQALSGSSFSIYVGTSTLTNSGTIKADGPGSSMTISANGLAAVDPGTIEAINGATLELRGGTFINDVQSIGPNSTFSIGISAVIDNSGSALGSNALLQPSLGGTLQLNGGTISAGTVNSAGGGFIDVGSGGTLDGTPAGGITLLGTLQVEEFVNINLQGLINDPDGFTFAGIEPAIADNYNIVLTGDTELSGNGTTTTLANGPVLAGSNYLGERLTIDRGHTLLTQDIVFVGGYYNALTLTNNGTIEVQGSGSEFNMSSGNDNSYNAGTIQICDSGLFSLSSYSVGTFTNTGTIKITSGGTLTLATNNFINMGSIELHDGVLNLDGGLSVGDGTLAGSGTINGNITLQSDPSTLEFQLRSDADYDSLTINGDMTLAGNLELDLADGFLPSSSDIFTVLDVDSMESLTGSFLNVADGGTLETDDGSGYFTVFYNDAEYPNEIVLTDFQPGSIPEPASAGILFASSLGLLKRRRRNH